MASLVNGKPAMKRIGYFGEEGYNGIGDMYRTNNAGQGPIHSSIKFLVGDVSRAVVACRKV